MKTRHRACTGKLVACFLLKTRERHCYQNKQLQEIANTSEVLLNELVLFLNKIMSETSSEADMSEEHLLDFVLEASDENQNFAASNVAEIMENFVCPPNVATAAETTYTDLSSKDYCVSFAGDNYEYSSTGSSPQSSHLVYQDVSPPPEWEQAHMTNYDGVVWQHHQQGNFSFPHQQIDCTNSSGFAQVPTMFVETNQHYQPKDFLGISSKATQQHHVTHRRQGSGNSNSNKSPKRRRVTTVAQRKAANVRERRRMFNLNEAFDFTAEKSPSFFLREKTFKNRHFKTCCHLHCFYGRCFERETS